MRWVVVVGLLGLGATAPARADGLAPRHVTASLHGTHARFVVQLRIPFGGDDFPTGDAELALPEGAIVTSAVAMASGKPHPLALRAAGDANAAFFGLGSATGSGRPWGVLVEAGASSAEIRIAAPGAGSADIELEIEAPTCFARDHRWVQVPEEWGAVVAGVEDVDGCRSVISGPWYQFSTPMTAGVPIGAIASRLSVAHGDLASVEIDLARELAAVPADLATAIVVDGSRSVTADEREAQRAIIASYLRRVPHSRVQLVGYARRAQPLLPGWMTTDIAAARIDRELRALPGRNGSNIDLGLAEAGAWLARIGGTRRVIVFTDERVADRLADATGEAWTSMLPAGTLVHVVSLGDGRDPLHRNDDVMFGALAKATGGIGAQGSLAPDVDATLLARPIALDSVDIHGDGWEAVGSSPCVGDQLPAGMSCGWTARGTPSAGPIEIAGLLWNRPVKRVVIPDPAHARTLARELSAAGGLDSALQADVDRAAMAVNAVWSLYATWGGDGGYADKPSGGHGSGNFSAFDTGRIVDGIGTSQAVPHVDLSAQLAGPLAACGAHASIAIELTANEIVEVNVTGGGAQQRCLEDAVWDTAVIVPDAPTRSYSTVRI